MFCFKCGKKLESAFGEPDDGHRIPNNGLIFGAPGNYGSRVYDPVMGAPDLVIWICDDCMREHHDLVQARDVKNKYEVEYVWTNWDPDAEPL
jgi:hypothetical protein